MDTGSKSFILTEIKKGLLQTNFLKGHRSDWWSGTVLLSFSHCHECSGGIEGVCAMCERQSGFQKFP